MKEYTIKSSTSNDEYSVILITDETGGVTEKSSCDCIWGSFYRFTQDNMANNKWKCAHIEEAIKKYVNKEVDNIEKEANNGEKKPTIQIHPIF